MIQQYYGIPKNATWAGFMERFPILFQDRTKPMTETCICFGIECPIGWYHILEQLCTILEFYNMEFTKNYGIAIVADQVKEKFGTLRFYYTPRDVNKDGVAESLMDCEERVSDEEKRHRIAVDYLEMLADKIIAEADNMTENTCARCGIPLDKNNKVVTQGWISYICAECDGKPYEEPEDDEEESETKEDEKEEEAK